MMSTTLRMRAGPSSSFLFQAGQDRVFASVHAKTTFSSGKSARNVRTWAATCWISKCQSSPSDVAQPSVCSMVLPLGVAKMTSRVGFFGSNDPAALASTRTPSLTHSSRTCSSNHALLRNRGSSAMEGAGAAPAAKVRSITTAGTNGSMAGLISTEVTRQPMDFGQ